MRIVLYASVMNSCSLLALVIAQDTICCFVWVWQNCLSMDSDGTQIENKVLRRIFKMTGRK